MNDQVRHIEPKSPVLGPQHNIGAMLTDLSLQTRVGIRGKNAVQQVDKAGFLLPASPNTCTENDAHTLIRLVHNEFWLLSKADSSSHKSLDYGAGSYPVLCQDSHAWFLLKTEDNAAVLAKLCSVDLRNEHFAEGSIVQTVVAGVNAIIVHHQFDHKTVFSILCDRSIAQYLWQVLSDVLSH
jgi:sarcosine oxidase subunit gamma